MRVLVVNAGSSSLKLSVLDGAERLGEDELERWDGGGEAEAVQALLQRCGPVDAVGHRVVHGGDRDGPARVDAALVDELEALTPLAPLHQPRAVAALRALADALPEVPAVACFDTSFHCTLPPAAATYALPAEWNARWGLRRHGFHGLSHAWAVRQGAALAGTGAGGLRAVTCHLGAGSSLCAVVDGRSVDTTMGRTPLEGLVMRTRSGSVDPGLLLWLLDEGGVDRAELADALQHRSGLAGLSGTSGDLRDVREAAEGGSAAARLAYDVLVHSVATGIGAMAVSAGGLDLLVLTGGLGEHAPDLRRDVAAQLAHLGVALDPVANAAAAGDADVSAPGAAARTVVVTAREDLEVARQVAGLLEGGPTALAAGPDGSARSGGTGRNAEEPRMGTTVDAATQHAEHPLQRLTAQDVMTAEVVTADGTTPVCEAMALLREHGVRHLPVVVDGRFAGMLDDRRIASALLAGTPDQVLAQPAADVMTRYVPQVRPETPMARIATLLRTSRCDALAVVDVEDRLLGIVTLVDVAAAVAHDGVAAS